MSIIIERGKLGVAVYDALTSRFKMLNVQIRKQSELERVSIMKQYSNLIDGIFLWSSGDRDIEVTV
jgi:hypothetical protein